MTKQQVFYVGTETEVAHHAAPLLRHIDVKIVEPHRVASFAKPNDLAIFFSEHFHRFRKAWLELNQAGCNTLYAIDGILEWRNAWENRDDEPACPWTMRPILSDKVACIGASQARVLSDWGNLGKCEVVGIPRFDQFLTDEMLTGQPMASPRIRAAAESNGNFRVLVTTAKWPGYTEDQVAKVTSSLVDLKNCGQQFALPDGRMVEFVWRLTSGLPQTIGVANQLNDTTGRELAEVLQEVDAVITTPSTVMLEGMLGGKPVAILDYTNSPRYVDAAWSITAKDQILSILQELAAPSARRMNLQQALLSDHLQVGQTATERMVELIEAMTRVGHDCRTAGKSAKFAANLLSSPPHWPTMDTSLLWPKHTKLADNDSTIAHQAVAAEALRRADHLQDRIDLLERELARAAEGFDRIANHPLLAPLVKVRKTAKVMGARVIELLRPAAEDHHQNDANNETTGTQPVTTPVAASLEATHDDNDVVHTKS